METPYGMLIIIFIVGCLFLVGIKFLITFAIGLIFKLIDIAFRILLWPVTMAISIVKRL